MNGALFASRNGLPKKDAPGRSFHPRFELPCRGALGLTSASLGGPGEPKIKNALTGSDADRERVTFSLFSRRVLLPLQQLK